MEKNNPLGVRKGLWTPEEDILLKKCIENYGEGKWHLVPFRAGLNRCRKSCRLRWLNYLKPNVKRGQFTKDEVDLIIRLHKLLGNRWSLIAGRLPGRTANDVKNFWNTHMEKKVLTVGEEAIAGRVNAQKPVAVRPQPRTFKIGSSHDSEIDNQPSSSSDECTRWWTNLLQMSTDLDHHSCTTTDSDTLGGEGLVDAPDHNHNLPPAAEDLDDWGRYLGTFVTTRRKLTFIGKIISL